MDGPLPPGPMHCSLMKGGLELLACLVTRWQGHIEARKPVLYPGQRKVDNSVAGPGGVARDLCFETTLVTLVQLFQNEEKEAHTCGPGQQLARFHQAEC